MRPVFFTLVAVALICPYPHAQAQAVRSTPGLVLDRDSGEVKHSVSPIPSLHATWAVAFSPSGKHLVYGTDAGEVVVWDLAAKKSRLLPGTGGDGVNRVRLVAFLSRETDETRF